MMFCYFLNVFIKNIKFMDVMDTFLLVLVKEHNGIAIYIFISDKPVVGEATKHDCICFYIFDNGRG